MAVDVDDEEFVVGVGEQGASEGFIITGMERRLLVFKSFNRYCNSSKIWRQTVKNLMQANWTNEPLTQFTN